MKEWWNSTAINVTWGQFVIVAVIFGIRAIVIDYKNSRRESCTCADASNNTCPIHMTLGGKS